MLTLNDSVVTSDAIARQFAGARSFVEILATTDRATQVENDPDAYLQGENIGSESGQC